MSTFQESLEERIERIRKSDELIEKKHREAEADRLRALKDNAMVKIKSPSDENWPRVHKYDHLDFTYDVKNEDNGDLLISSTAVDDDGKKMTDGQTITKAGRQYKKFADGDGPPPDPFYNFLADSSRDGSGNNNNNNNNGGTATMVPCTIDSSTSSNNGIDGKLIRNKINHNNNNNTNNNNNNNNLNNNFRNRNVPSNNSFKNRNNKEKSGNTTSTSNNNNNNNNYNTNNNQPKSGGGGGAGHGQSKKADGNYNSWKNEREKIDEARLSRQKSNEGKWKREWDNNKLNGDGGSITTGTDHKSTNNNFTNNNNNNNYAINSNNNNNNNNSHINRQIVKPKSPPNSNVNVPQFSKPPKFADLTIEHRGNITVSVSKDGEVKSVKLQSPKVIGTGRVGTRHQNVQGNFIMPSNDNMKHEPIQFTNQSTLIMPLSAEPSPILSAEPPIFLIPRNSVQDRLDRLRQPHQQNSAAPPEPATATAATVESLTITQ